MTMNETWWSVFATLVTFLCDFRLAKAGRSNGHTALRSDIKSTVVNVNAKQIGKLHTHYQLLMHATSNACFALNIPVANATQPVGPTVR